MTKPHQYWTQAVDAIHLMKLKTQKMKDEIETLLEEREYLAESFIFLCFKTRITIKTWENF